jgi:hypothetical protein
MGVKEEAIKKGRRWRCPCDVEVVVRMLYQ